MTIQQIRTSVSKSLTEGNGWPPSLPEFINLGYEQIDYHAAFMRCLAKKPEGRVEQWVYENAGYNIRVSSHEAAERLHKKFMNEGIEKEKRGELELQDDMLVALSVNSVKNMNDLKREEYEASHGKVLNPRIAKILERK